MQREKETGVSKAWLHHKGRNRHHFEYWIDYSVEKDGNPMTGMPMPRKYIAEMMMDRMAASKIYNGKNYNDHFPLQYYEKGKHHYMMHPQTEKDLVKLLTILDKKGEDYLYRYIRQVYLKGK